MPPSGSTSLAGPVPDLWAGTGDHRRAGAHADDDRVRLPQPDPHVRPDPNSHPTPETTPDRDLPPGPGGREPGIRLTVTPTAHGAFDVIETVRLAEPVTQLSLALPDVPTAGTILRGKRPVAEALQVRAGGRRIKVPNTTLRRATVISVGQAG